MNDRIRIFDKLSYFLNVPLILMIFWNKYSRTIMVGMYGRAGVYRVKEEEENNGDMMLHLLL